MQTHHLGRLARSLTGPFAVCGLAVAHGGRESFHVATHDGIVADQNSLFRVASISKIITGQIARDLPPGSEVFSPAGRPLRHPDVPDVPITAEMLAGHIAGLGDTPVPPPDPKADLWDWLDTHREHIFTTARPDTTFAYSNLGYILLAYMCEVAFADRFDRLARTRLLNPWGVTGGFNWSGVEPPNRARAIPTFRRAETGFSAQIDGNVPTEGIMAPTGEALDLSLYRPGQNPAVFAPHGGLRTSLAGMLQMASGLARVAPLAIWRVDDGPFDDLDGLFQNYGWGLQILPDPPFYPRPLIGHSGRAYGFSGGVWYDPGHELAMAYALNGRPRSDEGDALSEAEAQVFEAFVQVLP